jgi:hypothetical protein
MAWMYDLHLYGRYYTRNRERRFMDLDVTVPDFDLRDQALVNRLAAMNYPDADPNDIDAQVSIKRKYWK